MTKRPEPEPTDLGARIHDEIAESRVDLVVLRHLIEEEETEEDNADTRRPGKP